MRYVNPETSPPFDTPPLLRTSERKDFLRCPWKWYHSWVLGLRPQREPTWAWFGTAIHAGLEARYPIGRERGTVGEMLAAFEKSCDGQIRRIYAERGDSDEKEILDGIALGKAMLLGYVEEYGEDSEWEVIHTEAPFQIDVPNPENPDEVLVVYAGTWDLLGKHVRSKEYWLWDHKTRASFPSDWSFYTIDIQAGSYLWVAREVLRHKGIFEKGNPEHVIEGAIFNALKKVPPDDRPTDDKGRALNKDGTVSKKQPAPRYHREPIWRKPEEHVNQARRVQDEALMMSKVRRGELPLLKHAQEDCVRCQLFEYCQLDESDPQSATEFADSVFLRRDPYRDHRDEMADKGIEIHL